jgi:glutamate--cysteine ligase
LSGNLEKKLKALSAGGCDACLAGGQIGIEKESLRITPDGYIAATPHPGGLGSALTNRYITTDYSEALLEFVTPPTDSAWQAIQFLCDIHEFVVAELDHEYLWALSMPCMIRSEKDIPLARYGTSNVSTMKTVYRRGLGYRYGRQMQAIAGIHFNYSLPESFWPIYQSIEGSTKSAAGFRSDAYLGLVRNVRRLDWLLLYLFGASPAICRSLTAGSDSGLLNFGADTLYGEYATSLRMSNIGYQNANQAALNISANSLDEYIQGLSDAIQTPSPEFEKIGVKVDGIYRQLSANKLQIENEYYSTIRPKRVALSGERPTAALRRGGVEYIELRSVDISPFDPVGINQQQIKFLEIFLVYCLLADSPLITDDEQSDNSENHSAAAHRGRDPGLKLRRDNKLVLLSSWGREICDQMIPVCELLDPDGERGYADIVRDQANIVSDPNLTPSARFMRELRDTDQSLFSFGMEQSRAFHDYFRGLAKELNQHREELERESQESLQRQADIEVADDLNFEEYLARYFS